MENFLSLNPPKLTYLGLQEFGGNNSLAATLIILSKQLATLDLSEADFTLLSRVLPKLDRTNHITSINLSIMKTTPSTRQPSALAEMYSPVRSSTIADLTTKCIRLTDLVLCGADLSQDSMVQICNLVTPTLVAINLARERVRDKHVDALTLRCPNMKYIFVRNQNIIRNIPAHCIKVEIFDEGFILTGTTSPTVKTILGLWPLRKKRGVWNPDQINAENGTPTHRPLSF